MSPPRPCVRRRVAGVYDTKNHEEETIAPPLSRPTARRLPSNLQGAACGPDFTCEPSPGTDTRAGAVAPFQFRSPFPLLRPDTPSFLFR
mmetsp:Transcript_42456/g.83445  ORF Transcript_42456/g.83445 Transcript_42456/m.83445 type:complete len:89 (+) Transcript_42456:1930-2196(+)